MVIQMIIKNGDDFWPNFAGCSITLQLQCHTYQCVEAHDSQQQLVSVFSSINHTDHGPVV